MRVYLEYLAMGAIPVVDFKGDWFYIQENIIPTNPFEPARVDSTSTSTMPWVQGGSPLVSSTTTTSSSYYTRWEWNPARSTNRAAIPMLDFRLDQLREFLQNTNFPEEDGDLYITIRSSYELEGLVGRWLIISVGLFPAGSIQKEMVDYSWDFVERFCTLKHTDVEPEDETLARAWREMCAVHAEFEAEHQKREAAVTRSISLLKEHLTEEQIQELEQHRYFTMLGGDGRLYKISTRSHGNIWLLNPDGKEVMNFCIVVADSTIPVYDQMLTQKLMLEFDLDSFFQIANPTVLRPCG